ncbi:MAG: cysteine desulfurase family protein [Promethearchaeota archaeon]
MDKEKLYLDHAATTPVLPEVLAAMDAVYAKEYGNASSLHEVGQRAAAILAGARETVSSRLGVEPSDIIFTGSGTESDNLAIQGVAFKNKHRGKHIITSTIEHPAVRNTCRYLASEFGFRVTEVPVDADGIVQLEALKESITSGTILITIMYANNEIGTLQPVREIGEIARDNGIIFHTDAVQAFGKVPIDPAAGGFHLLSASAHKIYGPKGVGMLYMENGGSLKGLGKYLQPVIQGGGHEHGLRPATENIAGIAGFARAVEISFDTMDGEMERERVLQDHLIDRVLSEIPRSRLNGHREKRLPNNINFSFDAVEGESLLLRCDMAGYEVSTGSACSSKNLKASHVLLAIGLPPETAHGSLRVTLGRTTTLDNVNDFIDELKVVVGSLREMSPLWDG